MTRDGFGAETLIRGIAARQHGVVARHQLLRAGVAAHQIQYRLQQGRLTVLRRGIYREGAVPTPREGEMVALLACGATAVLSRHTAAAAWELGEHTRRTGPGRRQAHRTDLPVDVSIRAGHPRDTKGVRVHRVVGLHPDEVSLLDGLPFTTPARTLLDLAPVVPARDLEQLLARGLREGIVTEGALEILLDRYPRRAGTRRLRALLAAEDAPAFVRSEAEAVLMDLLSRARRRPPRTNVRVGGVEVDAYWPRERLVVEVDGYAFHSAPRAFESDRRRDAALRAKGVSVIRVTWHRLKMEPEAVVADIVEALAMSRR